ncbi:HpcH/HpaI aldolase/citrate lyase family protein [Lolliginicoccus lacisalsi]
MTMERSARRTILAVPGSNPRMIDKARALSCDAVLLDLEDAVAAGAKDAARQQVVEALVSGGWGGRARTVRVNAWSTPWTHRDVIDIVAGAGSELDAIVLPKADHPGHVQALSLLLDQLEVLHGLPVGRIGIEAQIESAAALRRIDEIASASPRLLSLVLGPADLMASLGIRTLRVGDQPPGYAPGDAYHHALMTILVAARAHGVQAIDGPFVDIDDPEAFERAARRTAALGYDGKWVIHPSQIERGNAAFTPSGEELDRARRLLGAYEEATSREGGARGAIMLDGEMVDEAGRALARSIVARSEVSRSMQEGGRS